jgi:hypothetical protein
MQHLYRSHNLKYNPIYVIEFKTTKMSSKAEKGYLSHGWSNQQIIWENYSSGRNNTIHVFYLPKGSYNLCTCYDFSMICKNVNINFTIFKSFLI